MNHDTNHRMISVCVLPCCEVSVEALQCRFKTPASEITLAMTGEDSAAPADPGGEEKQSSQKEL